jgi:hypothetical protein
MRVHIEKTATGLKVRIDDADGVVSLALTARAGEELSAAGIDECLRYMLQQVG